ncbi:hypothetical protein ACH5A3_42275 [Streptomyces echinatus]|uniref:hypothetical protein n=1 Tax=Streptomyces echinatus TaxID=67293 RepID=UPI00379D9462
MKNTGQKVSLAAAASALTLATVFAMGSSAQAAATSWNATDTQADVVGAWAHGDYALTGYDKDTWTVHATVEDTKGDYASARMYFRWRLITGGFSTPWQLTASGKGNSKSRSDSWYRWEADTEQPFEVKECIVDDGVETDCGGWDVPHPFN